MSKIIIKCHPFRVIAALVGSIDFSDFAKNDSENEFYDACETIEDIRTPWGEGDRILPIAAGRMVARAGGHRWWTRIRSTTRCP